MGLKTFTVDPGAEALTPDEVVAKVNAAGDDITRASSVSAAARPIETGEVDTAELATDAVTNAKIDTGAVDSDELAGGAVIESKIGALAVTGAKVQFDAISGNRTRAVGILTLAGQPLNNETVVIAGKTYTFETSLTDVDGNVLIGASASDSIDNLVAAINLDTGAGSLYAASMTEQTDVDASAGPGDTMDLVAQTGGTVGDSITTTETLTDGSFAEVTLTGGANAHLKGKAARDNLDADSRKERKYVKSEPVPASGDFTALKMKRTAGGLLEVEYDGIAV